jgi:hypothetical protein
VEVDEMRRLLLLAVLGGTAALVVVSLPDIKRYIRMRLM